MSLKEILLNFGNKARAYFVQNTCLVGLFSRRGGEQGFFLQGVLSEGICVWTLVEPTSDLASENVLENYITLLGGYVFKVGVLLNF